jgi:hypothetical protein
MLIPASLKGLKPGEISLVVLGRVVMGDIAVTLVDLSQRGLLQVGETEDGGCPGVGPALAPRSANAEGGGTGQERALISA